MKIKKIMITSIINELEVSKKKLNKYTKRRKIRSIKRLRFK